MCQPSARAWAILSRVALLASKKSRISFEDFLLIAHSIHRVKQFRWMFRSCGFIHNPGTNSGISETVSLCRVYSLRRPYGKSKASGPFFHSSHERKRAKIICNFRDISINAMWSHQQLAACRTEKSFQKRTNSAYPHYRRVDSVSVDQYPLRLGQNY